MKIPAAIMLEIERLSRLIHEGEISYEEAIDALEPFLEKEEFRFLRRFVHRRFLRNELSKCYASQIARIDEDDRTGTQPLPFPDLPATIEISPATFRHQNAMTLKDWDDAVRQAKNKADNAAGYLERILRAREQAAKMLKGDETLGEATGT